MDVERQMRAVEGEIVLEARSSMRRRPPVIGWSPGQNKTVVDDEKIYPALDRASMVARGSIDRRADLRDRAGVFDLQAVERIRPVVDLAKAQMLIGVGDDLQRG